MQLPEFYSFADYRSHGALSAFGGGRRFAVVQSSDESKLMIYYKLKSGKKNAENNVDEMGFHVFNENMEKIWSREVKMPDVEAKIDPTSYLVKNNGDLQMILYNQTALRYELLICGENTQPEISNLGILKKTYFRELRANENENGEIDYLGYLMDDFEVDFSSKYAPWGNNYRAQGIVAFTLGNEGDINRFYKTLFSEDYISLGLEKYDSKGIYCSEKNGLSGFRGMHNLLGLNPSKVIFEEGEGYCLFGEMHFYRGVGDGSMSIFGDATVTKVSRDGELIWNKKISKFQKGSGVSGRVPGRLGISILETDKSYHIIFVDKPKNANLPTEDGLSEVYETKRPGFLMTCRIDKQTGELEKKVLLDLDNIPREYKDKGFRISRVVTCEDDTFLLELNIGKGKSTMLKFTLNS